MSSEPYFHLKTHEIENLKKLAKYFTGIEPTNSTQLVAAFENIKASDILEKTPEKDIGDYIIDFKDFSLLSELQQKALKTLVKFRKQKDKTEKNRILNEIKQTELEEERQVNSLLGEARDEVRLQQDEKIRKEIDDQFFLPDTLQKTGYSRRGGKKTRKERKVRKIRKEKKTRRTRKARKTIKIRNTRKARKI